MQRRLGVLLVVLAAIPGGQHSRLQAQGTAPQAYTITMDPGFAALGPSVVKISRDGSKEVIDQTIPPGQGRDKEIHSHMVYDFKAHTLYTQVVSDPATPCGVQEYTDPGAPPEFDVISGSAALLKEIASPDDKSKQVGTETLNGILTKVMEVTSAEANGKMWLAQDGGFPVKIVVTPPNGPAMTVIEVKQLSFSKPPASAFALPASCAKLPVPVNTTPSTHVTALTLQPIGNYSGACPAHIKMVGTITVDGPGTVFYQFGAGEVEPGETLTFTAAGTKTVTHVMTFKPANGNQMGGSALLQAIGATAAGNHEIPTQASNNSDFNITCTSGGGR